MAHCMVWSSQQTEINDKDNEKYNRCCNISFLVTGIPQSRRYQFFNSARISYLLIFSAGLKCHYCGIEDLCSLPYFEPKMNNLWCLDEPVRIRLELLLLVLQKGAAASYKEVSKLNIWFGIDVVIIMLPLSMYKLNQI